MDRLKISQKTFLPSFPIKSQKVKCINAIKKQDPRPKLKLSHKLCKELWLTGNNSDSPSRTKILQYKNQNNFCEIRSLIMTPIRLTNVEISLPDFSNVNTPKTKARKIFTATNRRKSVESKLSIGALIKMPVEIIATRCSARVSTANSRMREIRRNDDYIMSRSAQFTHSLIRNNNTGSAMNYSPKRIMTSDRNKHPESSSVSPTAYSPIYTNNFDI